MTNSNPMRQRSPSFYSKQKKSLRFDKFKREENVLEKLETL